MPYSIRTIKTVLPISFALLLAPFFFAHGQVLGTASGDALQSDLNRLTESLDLLNAIKAGKRITDPTPLQTALNDVLNVSEEEIRGVNARLAAQTGLTDEETALRNGLVTDLLELAAHVKSVRADATQEAGTGAIISLAQKLKEWRDGPYAAAMARAVRFVNVFENEDSVKAAAGRLGAILRDQKKIRSLLPGVRSAPFMRLIKKAQEELKKAADLNARAKAALMPDAEEDAAMDGASIDETVRQSGALVNDAYNDFIAMSKLIRK